jgi:diguanylate cyclase (GGDEF)-like protein
VIDELTQLATRQRFGEFLELEWRRATAGTTSVALLMLDVDFFKPYNDTRGRLAGDECLRRVARVIAGRVRRPSDLVARYGGEEFAVILAGAEEAGALGVAHWIRARIEDQSIPHGASSVSEYVTVSIGVGVMVPALGGSPERLIADAGSALSRAKELGRNAVIGVTAGGSPAASPGI